MFDKLFEIFNNISPEQPKSYMNRESTAAPLAISNQVLMQQDSKQGPAQGTMIGYNYSNVKDDGVLEQPKQRFMRLNEFLRGRYK